MTTCRRLLLIPNEYFSESQNANLSIQFVCGTSIAGGARKYPNGRRTHNKVAAYKKTATAAAPARPIIGPAVAMGAAPFDDEVLAEEESALELADGLDVVAAAVVPEDVDSVEVVVPMDVVPEAVELEAVGLTA